MFFSRNEKVKKIKNVFSKKFKKKFIINKILIINFRECKFRKEFVQIMTEIYKYSVPSPIQSCVIPLLYKKQNVIGSSETGSGKTLSYLIPLIHNILLNKLKSEDCKECLPHKALIILPTKELCMQIYNECLVFCKFYTKNNIKVKYFTQAMFNGVINDFDSFLKNNDIIVNI